MPAHFTHLLGLVEYSHHEENCSEQLMRTNKSVFWRQVTVCVKGVKLRFCRSLSRRWTITGPSISYSIRQLMSQRSSCHLFHMQLNILLIHSWLSFHIWNHETILPPWTLFIEVEPALQLYISWCFSPLPRFFFQFITLASALTLVSQVPSFLWLPTVILTDARSFTL